MPLKGKELSSMEGKTAPGCHGLETLCGEEDPKLGLWGGQEVDGKGKGVSRAGRLGPGSPGRGRVGQAGSTPV